MRLDDDQMLLILMALVPVQPNDPTMQSIRRKFQSADKPHTEFDIEAEYRFQSANAIVGKQLRANAGRL